MGDISEYRGLIVVVTFLGLTVSLIAVIPAQLFTAGTYRTVETPDIFESIESLSFAETLSLCLNSSGTEWWYDNTYRYYDVDIGGHDIDFYYKKANETGLDCFLIHYFYTWIIFPAAHEMEWKSGVGENLGLHLSVEEMQANSNDNETSSFRAQCSHTYYFVQFAFNSTLWNNFTEAWNHDELYAFFGVNFDQTNTMYNAFALIGQLMFFALPDTHWAVNLLLNIPLWVCVAYLVFIFILRAVGAIFGGGGA